MGRKLTAPFDVPTTKARAVRWTKSRDGVEWAQILASDGAQAMGLGPWALGVQSSSSEPYF